MRASPAICRTLCPALSAILLVAAGAVRAGADDKRPSVSLKAAPTVAFAPARIRLTAELKGGPDDFEELYCPSIEWDWGDGTTSGASTDCKPYEAGKTLIQRRYSVEHVYRQPGAYRIQIRLKKGSRVNASAQAAIQVRAGLP